MEIDRMVMKEVSLSGEETELELDLDMDDEQAPVDGIDHALEERTMFVKGCNSRWCLIVVATVVLIAIGSTVTLLVMVTLRGENSSRSGAAAVSPSLAPLPMTTSAPVAKKRAKPVTTSPSTVPSRAVTSSPSTWNTSTTLPTGTANATSEANMTLVPSYAPLSVPTLDSKPFKSPSSEPSTESNDSTEQPSGAPTTDVSLEPTIVPSVAAEPSFNPNTAAPSTTPISLTVQPSSTPTDGPSLGITSDALPPVSKRNTGVTTFYAIGDVPYKAEEAIELKEQMLNLPSDAEFLIHVGDLRDASDNAPCTKRQYQDVADILRLSPVPVFVILGDNDWNDCPNMDEGLGFWEEEFLDFNRHWDHDFNILTQPGRPDNFAFVHKGTMFIGLNIVGGAVRDSVEWRGRLRDEIDWTRELIRYYSETIQSVGRVVLFGHADPANRHRFFFDPLVEFISDELRNRVPILYLCGDKHNWLYESEFKEQTSFLRIMVAGMTKDPVLKIEVHADGKSVDTSSAFVYDRRLR